MIPVERHVNITQLLESKEYMSIASLSEALGVSESTIRRDLQQMEKRNLLSRVQGGAALRDFIYSQLSVEKRSDEFRVEKQLIGRAAADQINSGDSVILDSGTTTFYVAKYLKERKNTTIITNVWHRFRWLFDELPYPCGSPEAGHDQSIERDNYRS